MTTMANLVSTWCAEGFVLGFVRVGTTSRFLTAPSHPFHLFLPPLLTCSSRETGGPL